VNAVNRIVRGSFATDAVPVGHRILHWLRALLGKPAVAPVRQSVITFENTYIYEIRKKVGWPSPTLGMSCAAGRRFTQKVISTIPSSR